MDKMVTPRQTVLWALAALSGIWLAACLPVAGMETLPPDQEAQGSSGIQGQVLIGPACPVMSSEQPCPDRPFQATITVLNAGGDEVTRFQSGPNGRFWVPLPAGDYVLRPEPPAAELESGAGSGPSLPSAGGLTQAPVQSVTVLEGQFIEVSIIYDSGIR